MTTVLDAAKPSSLDAAAEILRGGGIIGVPTDTVYGLAANPWHSGATDRLFRLKARPRNVELPLFVTGTEQALTMAAGVSVAAGRLMERFWPGPLTVVLVRRPEVDADLGDEDGTIGLRCPDHPVALELCRRVGPYATTSANRHGQPPATTAAALVEQVPGVEIVLDAGACEGEPSTVVDATGEVPKLLRAGAVDWAAIEQVVSTG